MNPVTDRSFGLLIAYLTPGFASLFLWGRENALIAAWLAEHRQAAPSVGGFLYVTIASVTAGLILSTLRWALLDKLHHITGLTPPDLKDPTTNLETYRLLVDLHYRYYQFYGSSLLVLLMLLLVPPTAQLSGPIARLVILAGIVLFYVASRDTLRKCYSRIAPDPEPPVPSHERRFPMTNGGFHPSSPANAPAEKPVRKSHTPENHGATKTRNAKDSPPKANTQDNEKKPGNDS